MTKVLHLAPTAASHEEIFMARYERLRVWALHLSANDPVRAEDLIQEAFIQFTLTCTDLGAIRNLDAYLFGLLRILHLSQLRRSKNRAHLLRMILAYDDAVLGLRAADPRGQVIMREQLQRVCQYACARKESSKAGSVLLLRFFLGYYPSEIAQICVCTRPAVEERLRLARAEAKAYLDDPDFLKAVVGAAPAVVVSCDLTQPVDAFLRDLRRHIYRSRSGVCLNARRWKSLYAEGSPIDRAALSHLASCPDCLDIINGVLGLPLLGERHPVDSLGKDTRERGGGGGGPDGGAGAGGNGDEARRCRQRARETVEHSPRELCAAVNGHDVGSQLVSGPHNEQTFNVAGSIDFVEVFSEQDVRLLLLHVGEPPPDGPFRHSARVRLSDGRLLEANLDLNYPASTLQVVYHNPPWRAEAAGSFSEAGAPVLIGATPAGESPPEAEGRGAEEEFRDGRPRVLWARLLLLLTNYRPGLRPAAAAAALSLLLVAALFLARWRGAEVSAAELLARAVASERAQAGDPSVAFNRVFYLEQAGGASGEPPLRRRVEVWQSASRALAVRRVYDEKDRLVIAESVGADGSRTVLSPGSQAATSAEARPRPAELLKAGALWRLDPSASVFLDLTGQAVGARVAEGADTYTVSYRGGAPPESSGDIAEAVLVIRKADLHGVELRVAVGRGASAREYRFVESQFTRRPEASVPASVFEIVGAPGALAPPSAGRLPSASAAPSSAPPSGATVKASAELEVEVNYLLHKVRESLGEQINVERTADERLLVEAVAETKERKAEILKALGPVAGNPAVLIEVSTVAEALRRRAAGQTAPTSVLDVEVKDDARGVDAELRRRFAERPGGETPTDEAIQRLSGRVISYSRRAVQHAAALRRLAASFPLEKSGSLDASARGKLLAMIRAHAEGYRQSVEALRRELLPLSPDGAAAGRGDADAVTGDAELARAADRLLQLSRSNDEAVRTAFALSSQGQSLTLVKSPAFWNSLASAEALARAILGAYQR